MLNKVKPFIHHLKIWPEFYHDVVTGQVTTQIRKDDRPWPFEKGHELNLQQFDPKLNIYTGHQCRAIITAVHRDFPGVEKGYCVLSIRVPLSATNFNAKMAGKKSIGSNTK